MTGRVIYPRVALVGLGLIASSMAHAMRAEGLAGEIVGHAKSAETRAVAQALFCDRVTETAAEAVAGADLVVLAVPVGAMAAIFTAMHVQMLTTTHAAPRMFLATSRESTSASRSPTFPRFGTDVACCAAVKRQVRPSGGRSCEPRQSPKC